MIADGRVAPYDGARRIWQISNEWWGSSEYQRTAIFVGLASEWEDHAAQRERYDAEIVAEAETLLEEGGLQPRGSS